MRSKHSDTSTLKKLMAWTQDPPADPDQEATQEIPVTRAEFEELRKDIEGLRADVRQVLRNNGLPGDREE